MTAWRALLLGILGILPGVEVAGPAPSYNLLVVQSGNVRRPFSLRLIRPAVQLAVQTARDVFNINFSIPDANFVDDGPTSACGYIDVGPALGLSSRHLTRLKKLGTPFFFIAPFCNTDMAAVAMLSVAHNVMTFTGFAPEIQYMLGTSSAVSRIGYSLKSNMQSILQTCLKYDWTNIAVIWYQWDPNNATDVQLAAFQHEGRMSNLEQLIMQTNQNRTSKIKLTNIIHNNFVKDANDTLLNLWKASNTSRAIVFLTSNDVLRRYMIEAYYQGYSSGGYVFIAVDFFQTTLIRDPMLVGSAMAINSNWTTGYPDNTTAYVEAMKSLLVVTVEMYADDPSRKAWLAKLLSKSPTLPPVLGLDQAAFMANAYDSVIILAYALRQHLDNGGTVAPNDAATNDQLSAYFYNQTFNASKAPISTKYFFIDHQGDKRENYYIYAIQDKSLTTFDNRSYQRFVDVTMELYEDLQKKCQMEKIPLKKSIEDLDDDIRMLYIALGGMIVGLIIATGFFLFATRRLHRKVARERKAYSDLLASVKATSRKYDEQV